MTLKPQWSATARMCVSPMPSVEQGGLEPFLTLSSPLGPREYPMYETLLNTELITKGKYILAPRISA